MYVPPPPEPKNETVNVTDDKPTVVLPPINVNVPDNSKPTVSDPIVITVNNGTVAQDLQSGTFLSNNMIYIIIGAVCGFCVLNVIGCVICFKMYQRIQKNKGLNNTPRESLSKKVEATTVSKLQQPQEDGFKQKMTN